MADRCAGSRWSLNPLKTNKNVRAAAIVAAPSGAGRETDRSLTGPGVPALRSKIDVMPAAARPRPHWQGIHHQCALTPERWSRPAGRAADRAAGRTSPRDRARRPPPPLLAAIASRATRRSCGELRGTGPGAVPRPLHGFPHPHAKTPRSSHPRRRGGGRASLFASTDTRCRPMRARLSRATPGALGETGLRVPTAVTAEDEPVLRRELRTRLTELWPELVIVPVTGSPRCGRRRRSHGSATSRRRARRPWPRDRPPDAPRLQRLPHRLRLGRWRAAEHDRQQFAAAAIGGERPGAVSRFAQAHHESPVDRLGKVVDL